MPSFAHLAVAFTAAYALVSSSALAVVDVEGNSATFAWTPSSGPVAYYTVYLDRNGAGFASAVAAYVSEPQVTIPGQLGERIRICVIAWGWDGSSLFSSVPSLYSEEVRFVGPANGGAMPYDFDGDGRTDLLWLNIRTGDVAAWFMNGTSPSSVAELGTLGASWHFIGSGDFDRDGRADLLLRWSGTGIYEIWFMNGGSVRNTIPLEAPLDCRGVDAIGDFDGDGYADLLWRCLRNSLVWFMRGATVDAEAAGPRSAGTAACAPDLDGDGRSDVIWTGLPQTVAWSMVGSSSWRAEAVGPYVNRMSAGVGCGDADGDGFGDVLWYHRILGGTLWAMNGDAGVDRSFGLAQLKAGWAMEAAGDFDGDGLANDILVRNTISGRIEVWELRWNPQLTGFSVVSTGGSGMGNRDWQVVAP
jgi:hypothetical protein